MPGGPLTAASPGNPNATAVCAKFNVVGCVLPKCMFRHSRMTIMEWKNYTRGLRNTPRQVPPHLEQELAVCPEVAGGSMPTQPSAPSWAPRGPY